NYLRDLIHSIVNLTKSVIVINKSNETCILKQHQGASLVGHIIRQCNLSTVRNFFRICKRIRVEAHRCEVCSSNRCEIQITLFDEFIEVGDGLERVDIELSVSECCIRLHVIVE